jgi:hypothetical protein
MRLWHQSQEFVDLAAVLNPRRGFGRIFMDGKKEFKDSANLRRLP